MAVFPTDHDGRAPWSVRIHDQQGQILEDEAFSGDQDGFEEVQALYQMARGAALDIDATIDGLLHDLGF
ncbi:hypothetical protein ASF74_03430 [Arthrobacter sp. Leaf145]|nr:hypothetical protein ASF74_03430 [Arthrobacter sp. Leaf145]